MARRRIRYISPLNAGKVLAHGRYWSLPFLKLYLEGCDEKIFLEPEDGFLLAQHAPELARRIGVGGEGHYLSEREKRSWRVRALAVWGSSCRAYGELTQAEAAYRLGFELLEEGIDDESSGELHLRAAVLALTQAHGDAASLVESALESFERSAIDQKRADALAIRGLIKIMASDPEGLVDSARVLSLVDPGGARGRRTMVSALHNMALAATRGTSSIEAQDFACRLLRETKRKMASKPNSSPKMKVLWVEGLLLAKMGITRLAEKRLARSRDGLRKLHDPFGFALASLDLVALLLGDGRGMLARLTAQETLEVVRGEMTADEGLVDALSDWFKGGVLSISSVHRLQDRLRGESLLPRAS
ncbi:MAG: hypothetical protein AAF725_11820 [Acidobacteriota bacterium]